MPDRPEDRSLVMDLAEWSGIRDRPGYTRFIDFKMTEEGLTSTSTGFPQEYVIRIQELWNSDKNYNLVYIQIARMPLARRMASPHCRPEDAPWRKSIMITERKTVRLENWLKIHGLNSTPNKEERFRSERVEWGIFIFGKERIPEVVRSGEATSSSVRPPLSEGEATAEREGLRELNEEESLKSWSLPDLPQCLGRITKYLMSSNRKLRLKGLQVLHKRFWHAKLQPMLKTP